MSLVDAWADAEAAAALALEAARMSDRLDAEAAVTGAAARLSATAHAAPAGFPADAGVTAEAARLSATAHAAPAGLPAEVAVTGAAAEAAVTGAAAEAAVTGAAARLFATAHAAPAGFPADAAVTGAAADADVTGAAAPAGFPADAAVTGAAARLFATAHAAPHMTQYAGLPDVLGRLMDAQVEAVYLGAESVQRRQLASAMAAPAFPSRLAAWAAEAAEPGSLRAGLGLLGWTLEFLRRARLLTDARQGAGFALADALCRLLAARALAAGVRTLHADGSPCEGFFSDLSVVESAAAASAVAHVCTSLVFGHTGPAEEDLRGFSRLRAAVDASFAGVPAARLRAAAFLLAIDKPKRRVT